MRSNPSLAHQARQKSNDLWEKHAQDYDYQDRQEIGQNGPRDFFEGLLGDRRKDKKDVAEGGVQTPDLFLLPSQGFQQRRPDHNKDGQTEKRFGDGALEENCGISP